MKRLQFAALAAAAVLGLAQSAQAGPVRPLYLSTGHTIQGAGVADTWDAVGNDGGYSLAVLSTIRTYGQGFLDPSFGLEYNLDGTLTGVSYVNTVGCCFRDGTTDGTYNYALRDVPGGNLIYRFDLNWANPELLADPVLASLGEATGIAYDSRDRSFWFSYDHDIVINLDLTDGSVTGFRMDLPMGTNVVGSALAYDEVDDSLWFVSFELGAGGLQSVIRQYAARDMSGDVNGKRPFLDEFVLTTGRAHGAEFGYARAAPPPVPEPAALALLGLGALALFAARRRR